MGFPSKSVVRPSDPEYEAFSQAWHDEQLKPSAILMAQSIEDVRHAMRYANETGKKVLVYATGHDSHNSEGALLLNLSRLNAVRMTTHGTIIVEGGAKWQRVVDMVAPKGLGVPLGSSPDVGVAGFLTGGGIGPFLQKHGYGSNSIVRITGVTPNGDIITLTPEDGPIFAALCGGGSGFFCITELEIRPFKLAGNLLGGDLSYPIEDASQVLDRYRTWVNSLDTSWTTSFRFEPNTVTVRGCCCDTAQFYRVYDWLQWRKPTLYRFNLLPFSSIAEVAQDPTDPPQGVRLYGGDLLSNIPSELLRVWRVGKPFVLEFRHIRGAEASKSSVLDLVSKASYTCLMGGSVTSQEDIAEQVGYVARLREAFGGCLLPGLYRNFSVDRHSDVYEAYSASSLACMIGAKRRLDPNDLIVSDTPLAGLAVPLLHTVSTSTSSVVLELTDTTCWPGKATEAYLLVSFPGERPEERLPLQAGALPPIITIDRTATAFSMSLVVNEAGLTTVHPVSIDGERISLTHPFCFTNAS